MERHEEDLESKDCSPIYSVTKFLTIESNLDIGKLERIIIKETQRSCLRILGLQFLDGIYKVLGQSWLTDYLALTNAANYESLSIEENVRTTHQDFKNIISQFSINLVKKKMSVLHEIMQKFSNMPISTIFNFKR